MTSPTRPVDNAVIATKGLQDRNIYIIAGTTVENKGKLILPLGIFIDLKVSRFEIICCLNEL